MGTKSNINLNINKDESSINDFLYCWDQFSTRPNKVTIHNNYQTKLFNVAMDEYKNGRNIFTEVIPADDELIINDKILLKISDNIYLSYVVVDRLMDSSMVTDITFYFKEEDDSNLVNDIIDLLNDCLLDYTEEESVNLNTISLSQNGLEIEPINNQSIDNDNLDSYYNSETFKELQKLVKKVKKNNKGLSILWGQKGTGKTAAINYIADNLDRIVFFIPNNLIEHTINNPDFRKFLKKHHKPIIIIDDCEMIFNEYFAKSNVVVNNLLQLVDGFLSDDLEVNIITIFNVEDEDEIDHTLLDCNNLIEVVEFSYLEEEEATELSRIIGHGKKYKNKTKLIDIIKKRNGSSENRIGF